MVINLRKSLSIRKKLVNNPRTFAEPLAGYLLDVFAKLRNSEFAPHSLTKLQNLWASKNKTRAQTVIEVGTYKGVTTKRLAKLFEQVISIEIDSDLYQEARKRCKNEKNIELILGDGVNELGRIAPKVTNALIFLDGHYSGAETGIGSEPEPVLKEIDQIAPYLENFVAIVIDDFRLFGVEEGWPQKNQVFLKLETIFPASSWSISVINDQIIVNRFSS